MDPFIQEYLERLSARLDAYTNAITSLTEKLDVHAVNTPTIVHNPPPPTTSLEITKGASAAVPDISCCTTKAQEIPTVVHDAAPVCIAMVPVTCSTECSTQVGTIDNVDEVHDAATVVHIEPTTDPVHQVVEQLAPVQATSSIGGDTYSIAKVVVPPMATTTNINPKAGVQELNALPLFPINTSTLVTNELGHSVVLRTSSDLAASTLTTCSTKCSGRAINPLRSVLYPAMTPSLPVVLCDNIEDIFAQVLPGKESQLADLQWRPWPPPTKVHIAVNGDPIQGKTHGCYVWWPPDHQPWMKSKFSWMFRKYPFLNTQVQGKGLTSYLSVNWFHLRDLVYNTWGPWLSLLGHCIRIPPVHIFCLSSSKQNNGDSSFAKQLLHEGKHRFLEPCACSMNTAFSLRESWKYLQSMQLKLPWPSFSSNGRAVAVWPEFLNNEPPGDRHSSVTPFSSPVTISVYVVCSLESFEHQFLAIPRQVNELARTFGLDKNWSTSNLVCRTQMHWKLSEHRARDLVDRSEVRPIPWPSFLTERSGEQWFLLAKPHDCDLIGGAFPLDLCHIGDLVCNLFGYCIRIFSVELLCLWSLKQDTGNSCFSKQLFQEGKKWLPELCACSITRALSYNIPIWLSRLHIYFLNMHKRGTLRTEHSSNNFLQFMHFGPYGLVCYGLHDSDSSWFASVVVQSVLSVCTIILAPELHNPCMGTMAVHLFWSMKKWRAWNTGLRSSRGLQLILLEPLLICSPTSIMKQWQMSGSEECFASLSHRLAGANVFVWSYTYSPIFCMDKF